MPEELNSQIEKDIRLFETWYGKIEQRFKLHQMPSEFSQMASSVEISEHPVNNWFVMKEAYSPRLPCWVVERIQKTYGEKIQYVLDPFVGSGTTGVSLSSMGIDVDGVEYNPFIHLIATVKSNYKNYDREKIKKAIQSIDFTLPNSEIELPSLTTLNNEEYFRSGDIQMILHCLQQLESPDLDSITRDFLRLGVAGAIEQVANLRKDGRALRFTSKPNRSLASVAIMKNWKHMVRSLGNQNFQGEFRVFRGSAMCLEDALPGDGRLYDLVLYSPPYLNNFDYTEVYKLELWLLGFLTDTQKFRELRKSTLRSHPSIRFVPTNHLANDPKMVEIQDYINQMANSSCLVGARTKADMKNVIPGYFDDMYTTLLQQWRLLRPGGMLAYVVANSRHKSLPVATDMVIAEIARKIGFEPRELIVLKRRNGRTKQKRFLRESIVLMQKPAEG